MEVVESGVKKQVPFDLKYCILHSENFLVDGFSEYDHFVDNAGKLQLFYCAEKIALVQADSASAASKYTFKK